MPGAAYVCEGFCTVADVLSPKFQFQALEKPLPVFCEVDVKFTVRSQGVFTNVKSASNGGYRLTVPVVVSVYTVGLFGMGEVLVGAENVVNMNVLSARYGLRDVLPSASDWVRTRWAMVRGAVLGFFIGILPGAGSTIASFLAYTVEKKVSKRPEEFGRGAIEGVAGPESANNAGAQTSFIPLLTLGLPSNAIMALMMGAMIIQGIQPGAAVMTKHPELFWGMVASMWIGNLMLVVINLPLIGIWVRLLKVPYDLMYPAILVFCAIGVYSLNNNVFDVYVTAVFTVLGYIFGKLGCPPAPLLIGFVLGPMMEEHLRRAMLLSRGDPLVFVERPISATLLGLAMLAVVAMTVPSLRKSKDQALHEE